MAAYKGAVPLIENKTYLEAAAGMLAAEACHAGLVRTVRYSRMPNIVPLNDNGIAYSCGPDDVLNIVYLNSGAVTRGGFFPAGVNGALNLRSAFAWAGPFPATA